MEPDDPRLLFEYQILDVDRGEVIINQLPDDEGGFEYEVPVNGSSARN